MSWILVAAGILMFGTLATAARVGVSMNRTPFGELADRLGRPVAIIAGINVFLIASCFQFSNNLGILAAIEPLLELSGFGRTALLVAFNLLIVACLFGLPKLYGRIEHLMMLLMGLMLLGFVANLIMARPSVIGFLKGLIPGMPDQLSGNFMPSVVQSDVEQAPKLIDPWITVQGLIATSFSIAGAFYQAYLVREKGWTKTDTQQGLIDSAVGTCVLIGISLMIMATAGTVLIGKVAPQDLKSAGDVALQLEPLFGSSAKWLFCIGIFAGALSSFLVNSMLGGTYLADGIGQDASIDSKWTKLYTVGVLAVGMIVALTTTAESRVPLIIFAQAMTVLGGPVLVFSLLFLATRKLKSGERVTPAWMIIVTGIGAIIVVLLAVRTVARIYFSLTM